MTTILLKRLSVIFEAETQKKRNRERKRDAPRKSGRSSGKEDSSRESARFIGASAALFRSHYDGEKFDRRQPTAQKRVDDYVKETEAEKKVELSIEDEVMAAIIPKSGGKKAFSKETLIELGKAYGQRSTNNSETRKLEGHVYTAIYKALKTSVLKIAADEVRAKRKSLISVDGFIGPEEVVSEFFTRMGTAKGSREPIAGFRRMIFQVANRFDPDSPDFMATATPISLLRKMRGMVKNVARDMHKEQSKKLSMGQDISINIHDMLDRDMQGGVDEIQLGIRMSKMGLGHKQHNIIQKQMMDYLYGLKKLKDSAPKNGNKAKLADFRFRLANAVFGPLDKPLNRVRTGNKDSAADRYVKLGTQSGSGLTLVKGGVDQLLKGRSDPGLPELAKFARENSRGKGGSLVDFVQTQIKDIWINIKNAMLASELDANTMVSRYANVTMPGEEAVDGEEKGEDSPLLKKLKGFNDFETKAEKRLAFAAHIGSFGKDGEVTKKNRQGEETKAPGLIFPAEAKPVVLASIKLWLAMGNSAPSSKTALWQFGNGYAKSPANVAKELKKGGATIDIGGGVTIDPIKKQGKPIRVSNPHDDFTKMNLGQSGGFIHYLKNLLNTQDMVKQVRNWILSKGVWPLTQGGKPVDKIDTSFNGGVSLSAIHSWLSANKYIGEKVKGEVFRPVTKVFDPTYTSLKSSEQVKGMKLPEFKKYVADLDKSEVLFKAALTTRIAGAEAKFKAAKARSKAKKALKAELVWLKAMRQGAASWVESIQRFFDSGDDFVNLMTEGRIDNYLTRNLRRLFRRAA